MSKIPIPKAIARPIFPIHPGSVLSQLIESTSTASRRRPSLLSGFTDDSSQTPTSTSKPISLRKSKIPTQTPTTFLRFSNDINNSETGKSSSSTSPRGTTETFERSLRKYSTKYQSRTAPNSRVTSPSPNSLNNENGHSRPSTATGGRESPFSRPGSQPRTPRIAQDHKNWSDSTNKPLIFSKPPISPRMQYGTSLHNEPRSPASPSLSGTLLHSLYQEVRPARLAYTYGENVCGSGGCSGTGTPKNHPSWHKHNYNIRPTEERRIRMLHTQAIVNVERTQIETCRPLLGQDGRVICPCVHEEKACQTLSAELILKRKGDKDKEKVEDESAGENGGVEKVGDCRKCAEFEKRLNQLKSENQDLENSTNELKTSLDDITNRNEQLELQLFETKEKIMKMEIGNVLNKIIDVPVEACVQTECLSLIVPVEANSANTQTEDTEKPVVHVEVCTQSDELILLQSKTQTDQFHPLPQSLVSVDEAHTQTDEMITPILIGVKTQTAEFLDKSLLASDLGRQFPPEILDRMKFPLQTFLSTQFPSINDTGDTPDQDHEEGDLRRKFLKTQMAIAVRDELLSELRHKLKKGHKILQKRCDSLSKQVDTEDPNKEPPNLDFVLHSYRRFVRFLHTYVEESLNDIEEFNISRGPEGANYFDQTTLELDGVSSGIFDPIPITIPPHQDYQDCEEIVETENTNEEGEDAYEDDGNIEMETCAESLFGYEEIEGNEDMDEMPFENESQLDNNSSTILGEMDFNGLFLKETNYLLENVGSNFDTNLESNFCGESPENYESNSDPKSDAEYVDENDTDYEDEEEASDTLAIFRTSPTPQLDVVEQSSLPNFNLNSHNEKDVYFLFKSLEDEMDELEGTDEGEDVFHKHSRAIQIDGEGGYEEDDFFQEDESLMESVSENIRVDLTHSKSHPNSNSETLEALESLNTEEAGAFAAAKSWLERNESPLTTFILNPPASFAKFFDPNSLNTQPEPANDQLKMNLPLDLDSETEFPTLPETTKITQLSKTSFKSCGSTKSKHLRVFNQDYLVDNQFCFLQDYQYQECQSTPITSNSELLNFQNPDSENSDSEHGENSDLNLLHGTCSGTWDYNECESNPELNF